MAESAVLTFDGCDTRQCVNVTIVDDSVDEPEEMFSYTIKRTRGLDYRITLRLTAGEVIIMDNESNNYYCDVVLIALYF